MVHCLVAWSNPRDRLFDITLRFNAPADAPRLLLPVWRPGRYLVQHYAANMREWGGAETVTYRYYAGVLDAGSSFLDDDEAYINGTNLFMLVEGLRAEEHQLTIAAPAEWRIETQLPDLVARDYDQLIDSPIIAPAVVGEAMGSEEEHAALQP